MTGKNSFSMERYEADKEEARKGMQLDRNKLNHADQLTVILLANVNETISLLMIPKTLAYV